VKISAVDLEIIGLRAITKLLRKKEINASYIARWQVCRVG